MNTLSHKGRRLEKKALRKKDSESAARSAVRIGSPTGQGSQSQLLSTTYDPLPVMVKLWCFIKGDTLAIQVEPFGDFSIHKLKDMIKKTRNSIFKETDCADMTLWKVSCERPADS
jgi:Crinkler effector protein N-terminal domain